MRDSTTTRQAPPFRLNCLATAGLLSLIATSTNTIEATSIAAGSVRERVKPWGLQSGPDNGWSTAAGIIYDRENDLVYVSGTTAGSMQFRKFSTAVDGSSSSSSTSSNCFLAAIQPPRYEYKEDAGGRGTGRPPAARVTTGPKWLSAYRMGEETTGLDLECLDLTTAARHDDEQKHLYTLAMQLDSDHDVPVSGEMIIGAVVNTDTNMNDMISSMDRFVATPASDDAMYYPVAVTIDPDNPRMWTVSQEGDPNSDSRNAYSAIILTQYILQAAEEPFAIEQEYQITVNTEDYDQSATTTVTTMEYADRHGVLLMAGSTTSGAPTALGGEPNAQHDDDESRDNDGFVAKLDPKTGLVLGSKRILFGVDDAAGATTISSHSVVVRDVCMDRDQSVLFLVGTNNNNDNPHRSSAFLNKVDFETLQVQWTQHVAGDKVHGLGCVVSDNGEFVFVAGDVHKDATLQAESFSRDAGTGDGTTDDVFCAKFDSDTGRVEWLSQLGSDSVDHLATNGGGLAVDLRGNPLLYGTTYGSMARTRDTTTEHHQSDVFLVQLSGRDGTRLSQPILPPPPPAEQPTPPAVDGTYPVSSLQTGAEASVEAEAVEGGGFGTSTKLRSSTNPPPPVEGRGAGFGTDTKLQPSVEGGGGGFGTSTVLAQQSAKDRGDDVTSAKQAAPVVENGTPTQRPPAGGADDGTSPTNSAGVNDGNPPEKADRVESPEGNKDTKTKKTITTPEEEEDVEEKNPWVLSSNEVSAPVITTSQNNEDSSRLQGSSTLAVSDGADRKLVVTGILVLCAFVFVMASIVVVFIVQQRQVSPSSLSSPKKGCRHKYASDVDVTETTESSDSDFNDSDHSIRLDECAPEEHRQGPSLNPTDSV